MQHQHTGLEHRPMWKPESHVVFEILPGGKMSARPQTPKEYLESGFAGIMHERMSEARKNNGKS